MFQKGFCLIVYWIGFSAEKVMQKKQFQRFFTSAHRFSVYSQRQSLFSRSNFNYICSHQKNQQGSWNKTKNNNTVTLKYKKNG